MARPRKIPIHQACTCGKKNLKTACSCRWELRYRDPEGKGHEPRFDTYDQAYAAYLKIQQAKRDGTYIGPKNSGRLFEDVYNEWEKHGTKKLSESTYDNYDSIYKNHFAPHFGKRKIGSIKSDDIGKWVEWEKDGKLNGKKDYSPYGIEVRLNVLSSVFNYAVRREIIGRNPCHAHITSRSGDAYTPVSPDDVPSDSEVLGIISELPAHFRLAGWFMAYCGLRPREALAVSLDSLDKKMAVLYVNHQIDRSSKYGVEEGSSIRVQRRGGKGVKSTKHRTDWESRYTPIAPPMAEQIDIHVNTFTPWGDEGWLFESPRFNFQFPSYAIFLKAFKDASAKVCPGRNVVPKSFRHYFVSMCLAEGISLYDIAQWVGHTDTKTTERVYAHLMATSYRKTRTALGTRMTANIEALARQSEEEESKKLPGWGVKRRDTKTQGLRDWNASQIVPKAARAEATRAKAKELGEASGAGPWFSSPSN